MKFCNIHSVLVNLGLAQVTPHLARKKAFLIGVKGDYKPLQGTHEDVQGFRTLLIEKFEFQSNDITMMLDDGVGTQPTEVNIMSTLRTFLVGHHPGDLFVFVYAGHAKQTECLDGTEQDGLDEGIITCDDPTNGYTIILDDVLHNYLVKPLAPGSRLIVSTDLKHHRFRRSVRRLREITGFPGPRVTEAVPENTATTQFCSGYCQRINTGHRAPNVICFSACKDS
ncbi:caspase domain-containing protein, partial [Mycena rosella]